MKKNILIILCLVGIISLTIGVISINKENQVMKEEMEELKEENREKNTDSSTKEKTIFQEQESSNNKEVVESQVQEEVVEEKYNSLETISYSTLKSMLKNKKSFILLFSQPGCGHCQEFKPVLNEVLTSYNLVAYDLDISKLDQEEKKELFETFEVSGTPTTIFIEEGEDKDTLKHMVGSVGRDIIIQKLKNANYIQ